MEKERINLIEIEGSPFEMGYQHGKQLKDKIALSLSTFFNMVESGLFELDKLNIPKLSSKEVTEFTAKAIPYTSKYAPEILDEIVGIAKGSGFRFEEIFALNCHCEVVGRMFAYKKNPFGECGCSGYALSSERTEGNGTVVGWNADDHKEWLQSSVLIRGRPKNYPTFILWNIAGCVGRPGINPYLGLSANALLTKDLSLGVPYCIISRKILQQKSVKDAISVITNFKRLGGNNYIIGDINGDIVNVETTSNCYEVDHGANGKIIHTNNYLSQRLMATEPKIPNSNPDKRIHRLRVLLINSKKRQFSPEYLETILCDHVNKPFSICKHINEKNDYMTLVSLICLPNQRKILVSYGNPCENRYIEYYL